MRRKANAIIRSSTFPHFEEGLSIPFLDSPQLHILLTIGASFQIENSAMLIL
jgi:hypothetical protein